MVLFLFLLDLSHKLKNPRITMHDFTLLLSFTPELASQLAAAESRCSLLEKQLEYMRKMIQHAENEKSHLLEKQVCYQDSLED